MIGRSTRTQVTVTALAATLAMSLPIAVGSVHLESTGKFSSPGRALQAVFRPVRTLRPQNAGIQAALLLTRHTQISSHPAACSTRLIRDALAVHPLLDREPLLALPPPVL